MIAYQTKENAQSKEYYPRSFEDAFIYCNREFIISNINAFKYASGMILRLKSATDMRQIQKHAANNNNIKKV